MCIDLRARTYLICLFSISLIGCWAPREAVQPVPDENAQISPESIEREGQNLIHNESIVWRWEEDNRIHWAPATDKVRDYFDSLEMADAVWIAQQINDRDRSIAALCLLYRLFNHPSGNPLQDDLLLDNAIVIHAADNKDAFEYGAITADVPDADRRAVIRDHWVWIVRISSTHSTAGD